MSIAKDDLIRIIQTQPEEADSEDIVREMIFHLTVERGLADVDSRRSISNEEMSRRLRLR